MKKSNVVNINHLQRDRGYRWKNRDPDMEWLCNEITKSGKSIGDIIDDVLDASNNQVAISYSCIANWMNGKTRRPQNHTLTWVSYALGFERKWTKLK